MPKKPWYRRWYIEFIASILVSDLVFWILSRLFGETGRILVIALLPFILSITLAVAIILTKKRITTFIFDMNGIIIDDEPLHEMAFRSVCKNLGIDLTAADYHELCMGITDFDGFERIAKKFNVPNVSPTELAKEKTTIYLKLLQNNAKSYPGVIDLIKKLKIDFRVALTSSASSTEVSAVLAAFDISNLFEVIITANDIQHGKPNPEPYLLTAKKLNVNPNDCVVFEDSKNGVTSAKAAGMKCVGIITTHQAEELHQADLIIANFAEFDINKLQKIC